METQLIMKADRVQLLQDLIRANLDAVKGYVAAAGWAKDPGIKELFVKAAKGRESFANDLRYFVDINAANTDVGPTLAGRLHRWWIETLGFVQNTDQAMLKESEMSEAKLKLVYLGALDELADSPAGDAIKRHIHAIEYTLGQIQSHLTRD